MSGKRLKYLLAGPSLFLLTGFALGGSFGYKAALSLGLIIWMGLWWITRPVYIGITGLLPIPINAVFGLIPSAQLIAQYFSEVVVLLIGADFICQTWSRTGLDKRLAMGALRFIGPNTRQQIAVWLLASTFMSVFLPNVVVGAIFVPVAIAMLKVEGEDIKTSHIAQAVVLAIVWGAGIGGFGSPIGGAANLVVINYMEELMGKEFMYVAWLWRFLPLLALVILLNLFFLLHIPLEKSNMPGSKAYFKKLLAQLGPLTYGEKLGLALFFIAMILSFARPLYAEVMPGLRPAYVFFACGLSAFFISLRDEEGNTLLDWAYANEHTDWGLLYLFSGGLALGRLITGTGAADALAKCITALPLAGGPETLMVFTAFTTLLTEISSNTGSASISAPVIISICKELSLDPLPYLLLSAVAINCAYTLPVSVRAFAVSYGLDPQVLFHRGMLLTVCNILLTTAVGSLILILLPAFGKL